jgi:hypothetical protein
MKRFQTYESLKKAEDLRKKRKESFDPAKLPEAHREAVGKWAQAGYDDNHHDSTRQQIPEMTGPMRARGLQKLHAHTETRRNPTSGEREFLLHRGMREEEHGAHVSGSAISYPGINSWSAKHSVAENFGRESDWPTKDGYKPENQLVSAWIPESKIHHVPKMVGQLGGDFKRLGRGEFQRDSEWEVLTKPGTFDTHKTEPIKPVQTNHKEDEYSPRPLKKSKSLNDLKKAK